jgi:hypothetical protein
MIIFKDLFDENQEFFCDQSFKYKNVEDFLIAIDAKMINKPSENMQDVNIGANPSQEEEQEQFDESGGGCEKCIDMCFYHKLQENEVLNTPKLIQKYIKNYMSAIPKKLEEREETKEKAKEFKEVCKQSGSKLLTKIFKEAGDNLVAFVGENFNFPEEVVGEDGKKCWDIKNGIVLGVWNEDGVSLTMYVFKHATIEEKV